MTHYQGILLVVLDRKSPKSRVYLWIAIMTMPIYIKKKTNPKTPNFDPSPICPLWYKTFSGSLLPRNFLDHSQGFIPKLPSGDGGMLSCHKQPCSLPLLTLQIRAHLYVRQNLKEQVRHLFQPVSDSPLLPNPLSIHSQLAVPRPVFIPWLT
jgi:hypothetical protein